MTRTVVAVLLLLILSGSSAVVFVSMSADHPPVTPAPASTVEARSVIAPAPTATQTLEPSPTPSPALPQPTPTMPAESTRPAGIPQPDPTPVAEPTATQQVWPLARPQQWAPTRLSVPEIGVDAPVVGVGLTDDGNMEAPEGYAEVGWYRLGSHPGEPGRAVIAGHVDSTTGPAVFYRLGELVPGQVIEVTLGNGTERVQYAVTEIAAYVESEAPLDRIFGPSSTSELILITCTGEFNRDIRAYDQRLVVYASLVEDGS